MAPDMPDWRGNKFTDVPQLTVKAFTGVTGHVGGSQRYLLRRAGLSELDGNSCKCLI